MAKKASGNGSAKFRFRKNYSVGSIEAETDRTALREAFLDTGDLDILTNTDSPQSVIVGRTGSGKSALLVVLGEREERVFQIDPASLALRYLTNSTILPYLERLQVRLAPFYQLLWQHALVTEVIRNHYHLDEGAPSRSILQRIGATFRRDADKKRKVLEYYESWSPSFWQTLDVRVREITDKLVEKLEAQIGRDNMAALKAGEALESTVREEIVERAQVIVNEVSLERIHGGLDLLSQEVLTDEQKKYFLVIDDLDKDWVELPQAYDLIDALLDAVGRFAQINNVKVVVALRENIVVALHSRRHVQSQQREKQRNLFLRLRWSDSDLEKMIDRRIHAILHGHYGGPLSLDALLPAPRRKDGRTARDWVFDRTFRRPRDIISFVNTLLGVAAERSKSVISWELLTEAERRYSLQTRDNIEDEWGTNYSGLRVVFDALIGVDDGFTIDEFADTRLDGILAEGERLSRAGVSDLASLPLLAWEIIQERTEAAAVWQLLLLDLYRISFVGVRAAAGDRIIFAYEEPDRPLDTVPRGARWYLHPALYSVLKIQRPAKP